MNSLIAKNKLNFDQLATSISGDFYIDDLYLGIYATDASNYQIKPLAIAAPRNEQDIIKIVTFAKEHKIPIMARGGGTSLVGQTVAEAIIIDFTKYLDGIIDINVEDKWAIVQPGIVRDYLNNQLAKYHLHFAPDPATSSRATIGGMIANNSSGTRSILYGKTLDHVLELKVLLDDGQIIHCKELSSLELEEKLELKTREGHLYRELFALVQNNRTEIIDRFPKVMRRVGGYNLDEFLNTKWNLCNLIVGSEGTLGIILDAKIKLEPTPKFQCLCIVHFDDFYESISHISEITQFGPASVELLDEMLIQLSRENIETKRYCDFIEGNPKGALVVEFYGDSLNNAINKAEQLVLFLSNQKIGYAHPIFSDRKRINDIFTVRKKGLGLLLGVKGNRKPIAFIEDSAVPLEHLADYIKEVFQVCKKYDTHVVAYAHASVGLLHVKPLLDLRDEMDIRRMEQISLETLELVKKYKGSWSGEHGDGLARSPYNESFFGNKLYQIFKQVKYLFDPNHILNPGKIVDAPPVNNNLRYGPQYKDLAYKSMFHFRDEGGFNDAVHLCNGVGECRKLEGGTMCPSFRATRDEKDSTRGRANALRLALSGQLDDYNMNSPFLKEVMDLCLSCKACKSECPSNVDMSKFKAEVLHNHHQKHGLSFADRLIINQTTISRISSGLFAPMVNTILSNSIVRYFIELMTGLDRRRILPLYTKKPFSHKIKRISDTKNQVVLFADTYMKFHDSNIGLSAKLILERFGYEVTVFSEGCCQRPSLSHGLLDQARVEGKKTFELLEPYLKKNIPIIMCEPSCATSLKDDIPDLLDDIKWKHYGNLIYQLEDFIVKNISAEDIKVKLKIKKGNYLLHGHCHQKAIFTTSSLHKLFNLDTEVMLNEIPSGCCGMAGSFGYEKKHYDISEVIANTTLIPAIKSASEDTIIIATGFSCRHQIEHFSQKKSIHWVEAIEQI